MRERRREKGDVRACALVLVHVGGGDGALELALEVFSRQTYGYRLSAMHTLSIRYAHQATKHDALFSFKELLSEKAGE